MSGARNEHEYEYEYAEIIRKISEWIHSTSNDITAISLSPTDQEILENHKSADTLCLIMSRFANIDGSKLKKLISINNNLLSKTSDTSRMSSTNAIKKIISMLQASTIAEGTKQLAATPLLELCISTNDYTHIKLIKHHIYSIYNDIIESNFDTKTRLNQMLLKNIKEYFTNNLDEPKLEVGIKKYYGEISTLEPQLLQEILPILLKIFINNQDIKNINFIQHNYPDLFVQFRTSNSQEYNAKLDQLISYDNPELANLILKGSGLLQDSIAKYCDINLTNLTPQDLHQIISNLLKFAIATCNVCKINELKDQMPTNYQAALTILNTNETTLLERLMQYEDPTFLTTMMSQFTNGFGKIKIEGGLLVAAETHERKKSNYNVNPTILSPDEFESYLQILSNVNHLPIREKFVITGGHWVCGEISITKKNEAKILFIDSLGESTFLNLYTQKFAETFNQGKSEVYYDKTKRQYSPSGCSTFTLDDMRHLFTIERYLPNQSSTHKTTDLFEYLDAHKTCLISVSKTIKSYTTQLPLPFNRTTQSSVLFKPKPIKNQHGQEITLPAIIFSYPDSEQSIPLGKNPTVTGKKLLEDFKLHNDSFIDKRGISVSQNPRLKEKLNRIRDTVLEYLLTTPVEQVKQNMHTFTFNGFETRMKMLEKSKQQHSGP